MKQDHLRTQPATKFILPDLHIIYRLNVEIIVIEDDQLEDVSHCIPIDDRIPEGGASSYFSDLDGGTGGDLVKMLLPGRLYCKITTMSTCDFLKWSVIISITRYHVVLSCQSNIGDHGLVPLHDCLDLFQGFSEIPLHVIQVSSNVIQGS